MSLITSMLNTSNCGITGNTGKFYCAWTIKLLKRFLMMPKGEVIPASAMTSAAALRTYIEGKLKHDTPGKRWRLSGLLSQLQDKTEDVKTENKDGALIPTQFPPYNLEWDMQLQMAQFVKWLTNFSETASDYYDFAFIDVAGNLLGTRKTDEDSAAGLGGVSLTSFYLPPMKLPTTDTVMKYKVAMVFADNTQLNQNVAAIQAGITASDWENFLYDVNITQGAANTSTAIKVQVFTDGVAATNSLLKKYGTELEDDAAWVLTKNGSPLVPSDVSYDAANDQMIHTVSSLSSGDVVTVSLAAPSVLTADPYFCNAVSEGTLYTYTHS